jgi:hypothetical protein
MTELRLSLPLCLLAAVTAENIVAIVHDCKPVSWLGAS